MAPRNMACRAEQTISGLREQIKANAAFLFPAVAATHRVDTLVPKGHIQDSAISAFEVVVMTYPIEEMGWASGKYQAYVCYNTLSGTKQAAQGSARDTVAQALQSLLDTTERALLVKLPSVFGRQDMTTWGKYGEGFIDEKVAVKS